MKTRDIVIGGIVLVVLIAAALLIRRARLNKQASLPEATPTISERVQKTFNGISIPTDRESADLSDVSGGQGIGVATRKYTGGTFSLTIMANLPTPQSGYFYQGWVIRGDPSESGYSMLSVGKLRFAKGGYIVDFSSPRDYSDYGKVVVSIERVFDSTPETNILEGSF